MNRSLLILSVLAGAGLLSFAQEAPSSPTPAPREAKNREGGPFEASLSRSYQVQIQVEFVEIPHEALTELLLATPAKIDGSALRQKVRELTQAGTAKLLDTQLVIGRSGEKQNTDSVLEFIYPTEYEPWDLPTHVGGSGGKDAPLTPQDVDTLDRLVAPATPTSFETRNLGSMLETQPNVSPDGKLIDLTLSPSLVWHPGNTVWIQRKDSLGNTAKIEMPLIYSLNVKTRLTLKSGLPMLAAVLSPKDAEGQVDLTRKLMVFVKADVLEAP